MSGGSFNYLYTNGPPYWPLSDIGDREHENMRRMADVITEAGHPEAAERLRKLSMDIERFFSDENKELERMGEEWQALEDLMKAAEWWQSGDWTPERLAREAASLLTTGEQ